MIGPGDSCTLSVTFTPEDFFFPHTYAGSMSFEVRDKEGVTESFTYNLSGTGFFFIIIPLDHGH
jgi:hypothetical protein